MTNANKTSIEWKDCTDDFIYTDGALYLVDDASGFSAVRAFISEDHMWFEYASDDFDSVSYDHQPDKIALISEEL